jgi:NAD(P)-dependent dehydrogenase (short-subunit alcohol dehydrogenase family)
MKIADKIVLVTGGANGIGKALCERFAGEGAERIFVADIDLEGAEKTAESVNGKAFRLDVADEENCRAVVKEILDETGRIDLICSNAGIGGAMGCLEVDNEIWRKIFEVNVLAHVYLARAAFPAMIERGEGAFLITASAAGLLTHPLAAPYAATKHAAVALAENLAIEYHERGIYVACLCPQGVRTNMIAHRKGVEPENFLMAGSISAEECADAVVKGLEAETFLILPHGEVAEYIVKKAENRDRWLHSLRKIRAAILEDIENFAKRKGERSMKIGIIGAGYIGGTAARLFAAAGHEIAIANSRGPETLSGLVAEIGERAKAATVEEAARFGDVVMVSIPLGRYRELPADAFEGKIVIDTNNYYPERDGQMAGLDSGETTSSELLQQHLKGARIVKAFNTIWSEHLKTQGDTSLPLDQRRVIFVAGDDAEAKKIVSELIEEIGFAAYDTGTLRFGGKTQEPGTAVYNRNLTIPEAEAILGSEGY